MSLSVLHVPLPVPELAERALEPSAPARASGPLRSPGSSVRFPTWKEPLPASPALPGGGRGSSWRQSIRVAPVGAAGWKVKAVGVKSKMGRFPKEPRRNQEAGGGTPQRDRKPEPTVAGSRSVTSGLPEREPRTKLRGPLGLPGPLVTCPGAAQFRAWLHLSVPSTRCAPGATSLVSSRLTWC